MSTLPHRLLRRLVLVVAPLALVLAAADQHREANRERQAALRAAQASGVVERHPDLPRAIAREPDPERGRLLVAGALVRDELDPSWLRGLPPPRAAAEARGAPERQASAHALAAEALRRRPASAEARALLGTATFLERLRRRDTRVYASLVDWEAPLRAAVARGPADPRHSRELAAAYLEVWFALSDPQRQAAMPFLRAAFADPATFAHLMPRWLAVARDPGEAGEPLPDRAEAWQRVAAVHGQQGDWGRFLHARAAGERALQAELEEALARGEARLAAGDLSAARMQFLSVATRTSPQRLWAPLLVRALERCPPGIVGARDREALQSWLRWALDARLYGREPLPPATVGRLTGMAGKLPDPEAALAALAAEELPRAEMLERRSGSVWSEAWGPYLIVKAEALMRRRDLAGARAALAQVHRNWHASPLFFRARQLLERETTGAHADASPIAAAERPERARWPATDWRYRRGQPRLEALARPGPARLALTLHAVPATGAVVQVYWDGAGLGPFAVRPGQVIEADIEVTEDPHLVTLESLAGSFTPGEIAISGAGEAPGPAPAPTTPAARR